MAEQNPDLPHASQTDCAHMCGHDGHTAAMLGFIALFQDAASRVPSDKAVRVLFQPSEEGPASGALQMIKEGCLDGVDEIYGLHNWPFMKVGTFAVKSGAMMAEVSIINITVHGKGGHGSAPEKAVDPLQVAIQFFLQHNLLNQAFKREGR